MNKTTENIEVAKAKMEKRKGEVIREARLNGIRPMRIERLLAFLGYDMNTPDLGRAEAVDTKALRRLIAHRPPRPRPARPEARAAEKVEMQTTRPRPRPKDRQEAPTRMRRRRLQGRSPEDQGCLSAEGQQRRKKS